MGSHESRSAEVPALSASNLKSDGLSKMKHNVLYAATLLSALGCGLIAGVFFSFSSFVMKSLVKLPPTQGIAAMQSINVVVINRWFMSVFFGTAIICLVLAILSVFRWQTPGAGYRLIGSLLYLLGTILVTIVCNVPLNDSLAAVDPTSANAAQAWAHYVTTWTAWNHLRTIAALAAAAAFTAACCRAA
jgi:uncharacterized membrane protein